MRGRGLCGERRNSGRGEDVEHGALSAGPDWVRRTGRLAIAVFAAVEANVEADGAVDRFDDLEDGGIASTGENGEAAEFAAAG